MQVNVSYQEKQNPTIIIQVYNCQRIIATWCFRSNDNQRGIKKQPQRKAVFIGSWEHKL